MALISMMRNAIWLALMLFVACLCGGCAASAYRSAAPPLAGRWEGVAEHQGARLSTVVDFSGDVGGGTAGQMGFPEASGLGFALMNVREQGAGVHFEKRGGNDAPIAFDGTRRGDVLEGVWGGGGLAANLTLRRTGDVPPSAYTQEEVSFAGEGGVTLNGSLLLPRDGATQHPAVVLIHGSSTPDREDWRAYADLFARHGFAALIYDKRNFKADKTAAQRYDLNTLAGDTLAAVRLLRARTDIDRERVGLWGLSEGGMVAPLAASKSPETVAFVVAVSGPGVPFAEFSLHQNLGRLRARGFDEAALRAATDALTAAENHARHEGGDVGALQALLDRAWQQPWAQFTTLPRRVPTPEEVRTLYRWRDLDLDPAAIWEHVNVPALALYGAEDDRFPVARSVSRVEAAIKRGGNRDATLRVFPQADHEIMLPMGARPDTNGKWDWPRPAPVYLETMLVWMSQHAAHPR